MRSYYLDAGQKELQTLALKVRNNFIFIAWACERHCPRHQRLPTYIPRLGKASSGGGNQLEIITAVIITELQIGRSGTCVWPKELCNFFTPYWTLFYLFCKPYGIRSSRSKYIGFMKSRKFCCIWCGDPNENNKATGRRPARDTL